LEWRGGIDEIRHRASTQSAIGAARARIPGATEPPQVVLPHCAVGMIADLLPAKQENRRTGASQ
jgi:hypothetical protein